MTKDHAIILAAIQFVNPPDECCDCPFATNPQDVNLADPGEGYYDCTLIPATRVWGESPKCKSDQWKAALAEAALAQGGAHEPPTQQALIDQRALGYAEGQSSQGWQPIATAPKDGTWFLVSGTSKGKRWMLPDIAQWSVANGCLQSHDYEVRGVDLWMPLPVPPTGETP